MQCSVVQFSAVQCSAVNAVQCSEAQCGATQRSVGVVKLCTLHGSTLHTNVSKLYFYYEHCDLKTESALRPMQ